MGLTEGAFARREYLDRFLLALCLWREARGESLLGKQFVADVIRNRVWDTRWPDTVREVILQPRQFSAMNLGDPNSILFPKWDDAAWADCLTVADASLAGEPRHTSANHYCTVDSRPAWRDDSKITETEGRHVFFAL